jgi:phosphate:Na+ symporter
VSVTIKAYRADDLETARKIEPLEEAIDFLSDEMKLRQVERLRHRQGNITLNFVFNDLIMNYERISDHCSNVALAMLRLEEGDFKTHNYQEQLLQKRTPEFEKLFTEYRKKFSLIS